MKRIALTALGTMLLGLPASATGIDSRIYTCAALQALISANRFVFISAPAFGDFVVADAYYCTIGRWRFAPVAASGSSQRTSSKADIDLKVVGMHIARRITGSGVYSPYSAPTRAPFSATERFINSTTNTSAIMTTASTQKTSK